MWFTNNVCDGVQTVKNAAELRLKPLHFSLKLTTLAGARNTSRFLRLWMRRKPVMGQYAGVKLTSASNWWSICVSVSQD